MLYARASAVKRFPGTMSMTGIPRSMGVCDGCNAPGCCGMTVSIRAYTPVMTPRAVEVAEEHTHVDVTHSIRSIVTKSDLDGH